MEQTKSFGGNHNLAYEDYELFGLPENSKTVDTSAFEELFGNNENGFSAGSKPQQKSRKVAKKTEKKPVKKNQPLFKVLSGLMTMSFILLIFSIIIS